MDQKATIYQLYNSDFNQDGVIKLGIGGLRVGYVMSLVDAAGFDTSKKTQSKNNGGLRAAIQPIADALVRLVVLNQLEGHDSEKRQLTICILKKVEHWCRVFNKIFTVKMVKDPYLVSRECNKFIDTLPLPRTQVESMDDNNMETTNSTASVDTSVHPPTNSTITSVSTFQTRQEANNPVQH